MAYIGNEPSVNFTSFAKQDITGDGGANYTLTYAVANANEIEVFVNNVRQEPSIAYTVTGTALSMTGNVASTDDFYVIYLGKALQTTVPPDGSVSTAKIADNAVTSAKISYPLTTFSSTGIDDNATSTAITVDASQNVGIGTSSPTEKLTLNGALAITGALSDDRTSTAAMDFSSGVARFVSYGASGTSGIFAFRTASGGASSTERMNISSNGRININTTADLAQVNIASPNLAASADALRLINAVNNTGGYFIRFVNSSGNAAGYIEQTGTTSVSYTTSSDHRLKENIVTMTGAIDRVKQLLPKRFNFIADGTDKVVDGFLAHEAQTVVPEAISGTHNGLEVWKEGEELPNGVSVGDNKLDDDGNTIPKYQGIDQSKLVPLLTGALKEAITKIEELEARITALENS